MKHGRIFTLVLAAGILMLAQNLAAQWTGSASAPVAVTDSSDNQTYPFVFSDGSGGVLIPYFADSANWGMRTNIFVQRLDNTGTPQWGVNGVQAEDSPDNIIYDEGTKSAAVVSDGHGGVIVVYKRGTAPDEDIYACRVNAAGNRVWGADRVVCDAMFTQQSPVAISDGQGGAFVVWADDRDQMGTFPQYLQRIDSLGNLQWDSLGVPACTLADSPNKPVMVKDGAGGVIVTWSDCRNFRYDVYGQRFNAAGTPLWSAGGVMLYQDTEMMDVVGVTMTYGGNGHILMGLIQPQSTDRYLKAQKIDTLGTRLWGASAVQLDYSTTIAGVNVLSDGADGMVLVWHREWTSQVVARRIDAGGSPLWGTNMMLSDGTDYCMNPRVVNDSTGTFMAVWSDSSDMGGGSFIRAQRFDMNGTIQWDNGGAVIGKGPGYRGNPVIISDTPGQAMVAWNENNDFTAYDIAAQRIPLPPPVPNVYNWNKGKYYTTLAEALDSTENDSGDIIYLLKDTTVQVTATMVIPGGVTVAPAGTLAAPPVFDAAGFNGIVFKMHDGSALTGVHIAGAESSAVSADNCFSGFDVNDCTIESCATRNGIPALNFYYCDKIRLRGNRFFEASGSVPGVPLVKFEGGNGSVVVNNIFLGTWAVGLELYSINSGQGVEVRHNLFDGFGNNGAVHNSNADYIHVVNNIFTNNQTAIIDSFSGMGFVVEGNAYFNNTANTMSAVDPAAVMADPVFADPGNSDFHLSYHSPCIDAGHADSVWIDRDGSRPDIGPYGGPFADTTGIPPHIKNFQAINGSGYDTLSWAMSPVGNFLFYAVYRDTVDSAGFKIGPSTLVDSIAVQGQNYTILPDNGQLWTYRVCAVSSDSYAGGFGEASGHAPVLVRADYEDRQTTWVDDDTLFLKFNMPLDAAFLSNMPDSHFVPFLGNLVNAQLYADTLNDSVLKIAMGMFDVRPESIKVKPGGVRGQNGVLSLEGTFLPVKNPSPFLRRALYQDNGTPQWGDDVVTLIFSAPIADSSVETAAKESRLDFAMPYGNIDSATTVTGIPNDETLYVQLHWQDTPGEFFYVKPFAVQDSGGVRSLVDTTLVWVENISRPYVDSMWPANAETLMVETWDTITVWFSRGVDASSLDDQTFQVYGSIHGRYSGHVSYDPWSQQAGFNPDSMFANGELITCVVTRGVRDSLGIDSLARPCVWSFRVRTTGGSDSLGYQPYWTVHDTGAAVTSITWADVDGNRYPDLIVGRSGKSNLVYFNHNGHLDFMPGWHSTELEDTRDIAVTDINGDGLSDLICANYGQYSRVYLGNGSGFNVTYSWSSTNMDNSRAVDAADIDGNGYPDIILGNDGQSDAVYFNYGGTPELTPSWTSALGFQTYGIRAVDVNNDGNVDLVCAANDRNVVYRNYGDSLAVDTSWSSTNINFSNAVDAGDMDRDGDYDLVFANDVSLNNAWYRTLLPDSVLGTPWWNSSNTSQSQDVQVADMDGDGDYDLAFANRGAPHAVYYNTGTVQTIPSWTAGVPGAGNALALADIDLDGDLDMACLDSIGGSVMLGIHLAGDAPPWIDSLRMSQDTTGRDTVAPGLVYIDFYGADIESDSFAVNDAYFAADDTNSWTWFSTASGGFKFTPAGSTYTALWFSAMDTAIESDSVWLKMSFWEPMGSFTSDNFKAGPFSIDTKAPALSGSLHVSGGSDSSITLSWNAATEKHFSRYEIWYDTTGTVDGDSTDSLWGPAQEPLLNNIGTNTATVTGLHSGQQYWFALRAVDSLGNDTMTTYIVSGTTFVSIQGIAADSLTHSPLSGIEVVIYRDSMTFYVPLDTAMTDGAGLYLFDKIRIDADYKLHYSQPGGNSIWYNNEPDSMMSNSVWCTGDTMLDTAFMPPIPLFQEVVLGLDSIQYGRTAWGDYDGDGDLDVAVCGKDYLASGITVIYRNDGSNTFTDISAGLPGLYTGTAVWQDYDRDGDLDLLISGDAGSFTAAAYLYRNDGGGTFTDVSSSAGLIGLYYSAAAWADYDGDGDPDLVMTGQSGTGARAILYRNEGADSFSVADSTLDSLEYGDAAWADYDGDGDPDLLLTGSYVSIAYARLYRNDGGVLTDAAAGLTGVYDGSVAWGDYDNDGDPDILQVGDQGSVSPHSVIYRNDAGSFVKLDAGLDSIYTGAAAWIDYNSDGWLDIVQTGYDTSPGRIADLYQSEAGTAFVKVASGLAGLNFANVSVADADNDGRQDVMLNGLENVYPATDFYLNMAPEVNTAPLTPVNPGVTPSPDTTYFFWNAASDSTTPLLGLSYNIALGTSNSTFDVISPMADPATGYRYIPARGNVGQDTVYRMAGLAPGRYYWQVQAIDHSCAGSPFTMLDSFDVAVDTAGPVIISADYYSNGTLDAFDDSLFITFSEKIVFDSLDLAANGASSDFNLLGHRAYITNVTTAIGTDDSSIVLTFTGSDSILSRNRAQLVLLGGEVYDSLGNGSPPGTVMVNTWNVWNTSTATPYQTIDEAQTNASSGHNVVVLDEGYYTEDLYVAKDLTLSSQGHGRAVIRYGGTTTSNGYLIQTHNGIATAYNVSFDNFEIDGINYFAGNDTLTKLIYAGAGTWSNCDMYHTGYSMSAYLFTTASSSPGQLLVIDGCEIHDAVYGAISWSKNVAGSRISHCEIYNVPGSTGGIDMYGADSSIIYGNIIKGIGFAGINTLNGSDHNLVYGNLITGCMHGINTGTGTAGRGNRFYFNTVYGNSNTGFFSRTDGAMPDTFKYNIVWGNTTQDVTNNTGIAVSDYNCFGTAGTWTQGGNSIVGDPLFVNVAMDSFFLQTGSPCLGVSGIDSLGAVALGIENHGDLDKQSRPAPAGSFWDLGAFEEPTVLADFTAPDADVYLKAAAVDSDAIELTWSPALIGSTDAESVIIRYRTDGVFPADQVDGIIVGAYTLTDSVDTLSGLPPAVMYRFGLFVGDSSGNWSGPDTLARDSIYLMPHATSVLADLLPDTAVAGSVFTFDYSFIPTNGTVIGFKVLNPFGTGITVTGIQVNSAPMNIVNTAGQPTAPDTVTWSYVAGDTLYVFPYQDWLKAGDTLTVTFTDTVPAAPGTYTFNSLWGHQFVTGTIACSTATGTEWDVTVVPGAPAYYELFVPALTWTAGVAVPCTLEARDMLSNTLTNFDTAGVTYTFTGPLASPDGSGFIPPADEAINDSMMSPTSGGSVGRAVVPLTIYNAAQCSIYFEDNLRTLSTVVDSIVVLHDVIDSMSVAPAGTTITADDSIACSAKAFDAWGNPWDVTDSVSTTWTATGVSGMSGNVYHADSVGTWQVSAANGGFADTVSITVTAGAVASLMLSADSANITMDSSLALTILAMDADSNYWDVTGSAVWYGTGTASLVDSGTYLPDTVGSFMVRADYSGSSDTCYVTVEPGTLASYTFATDEIVHQAGAAFVCTLRTFDLYGNILTNIDTSNMAFSFSGPGTSPGGWSGSYPTDMAVKESLLSVTSGGSKGAALLPVILYSEELCTLVFDDLVRGYGANIPGLDVQHAAIGSLSVAPSGSTITADDSVAFDAKAFDAYGNPWDVSDLAVWSGPGSASPVDTGKYAADTVGTWDVRADYGGFADSSAVTVVPGAIVAIGITPSTGVIPTDSVLVLTAIATDLSGNQWNATDTLTWMTDDVSVTVDSGRYDPDSSGSYKVWAYYSIYADTCLVTVNPGAAIAVKAEGLSDTVTAGDTAVYSLTAMDADSVFWDVTAQATWEVTPNTGVDTSGANVISTLAGAYTVVGHYLTLTDTLDMEVVPDIAESILVTIPAVAGTVLTGEAFAITAAVYDKFGNTAEDYQYVQWSWFDPDGGNVGGGEVFDSIASPVISGVATMNFTHSDQPGDNYRIEASVNGAADTSAVMTVKARPLYSVVIVGADSMTPVGDLTIDTDNDTTVFFAHGYDSLGTSLGLISGSVWSIVDAAVGSLTNDTSHITKLIATTPGMARIVVSVNPVITDTTGYITVNTGVLAGLTVAPAGTSIASDDTLYLISAANDADGNTWDITSDGGSNWNTDDISGSVMNGIYVPQQTGSWKVWNDNSGFSDTALVTVTFGTMTGIVLSPDTAVSTADSVLHFSVYALDAAGNTSDMTGDTNIVWETHGSMTPVSGGTYYADTAGTWLLGATFGAFGDTSTVVISAGVPAEMNLCHTTATIPADSFFYFTADIADTDGNITAVTASATWGTDDPAGSLTVTGIYYYPKQTGTYKVWAVYGSVSDTCVVTVTNGTVTALDITPDVIDTVFGDTVLMKAMASDVQGNTWDVTDLTAWICSDAPIASIDSGKLVSLAAGTTTVMGTYGGYTDTSLVMIAPGTLDSITLALSATAVPAGSTVVCTVMAYHGGGVVKDVSGGAGYTLSSTAGVTADSNLITATLAGTYTVTASYQGFNRNVDFTVQALDTPDSVAFLAPAQPETVAAGAGVACTLAVFDMYGNVITDPVTLVLTAIDPVGGNTGTGTVTPVNVVTSAGRAAAMLVVSASGGDNFAVTATYLGTVLDTSLTVTVENNKIAQLRIMYADSTGSPVDTLLTTDDDSLKLVAVGLDSAGTVVGTIDSGSWTVSDTLIASVMPTAGPPAIMMLYGTGTMTVSVSAMVDGQSLTATTDTILVVAGKPAVLTVSPGTAELLENQGQQFTVAGTDADGNAATVKPLWSLSNTTVGTIDTNGYFTAQDTGSVTVMATDGPVTGSAQVAVIRLDVPLDRIVIKGAQEITVSADSSVSFTADGYDENDSLVDVGSLVQWQVTDSTVLKSDSAGAGYEAARAGSTLVIGSIDSLADTVLVIVIPGVMVTASLDQGDTLVGAGVTVKYTVSAYDADGNAVTAVYTWSLSDNTVGSVTGGSFRGTQAGSTWVFAANGTFTDSAFIRVIDDIAPQAHITVSDSSIDEASARITISAADTLGHTGTPAESLLYAYRVNGGVWQNADSSVIDLFPLDDGSYTVGVKVTDGAGNVDSSQQVTFTVSLGSLEVPAQRWQLISIPKDVKGAAIGQLITADTTNTVHLYRWSESADTDPFSLKYLDVANDALVPGYGYWLLTSAVSGLQLDSTTEFITGPDTIALQDGWNMIGNPYGYTISLQYDSIATKGFLGTVSMEEAIATGLVENVMHGFNGLSDTVEYTPVSHMGGTGARPWQGYWLKANGAYDLILDGKPYRPEVTAVKQAAVMQDWNDWTLNLTARAGLARDRYNSVGIKPGAAVGQDCYDASEPPQMSPFVSLGMVRDGRLLSADYQDGDGDVREWYFRVSTDAAGEPVTLGWDGLDHISPSIGFYLYDLREGTMTDLRRQDRLSYRADGGDRHFKLVASGSFGFVPEQLPERAVIGDIAPNPVRDRARIPFTVPAENRTVSPVRLGVYDLAGNLVRQLVAENLPAGSYAVTWDGRDGSGRRVTGGLYFCRLSSDTWTAARQFEVLQK